MTNSARRQICTMFAVLFALIWYDPVTGGVISSMGYFVGEAKCKAAAAQRRKETKGRAYICIKSQVVRPPD